MPMMPRSRLLPIAIGACAALLLALSVAREQGQGMADKLASRSREAIAKAGGTGITASFITRQGWPTRHPVLSGGEGLDEGVRARTARAVAAIAGVGAVRWANGQGRSAGAQPQPNPLHCQDDVEALLRTRSIRFREGSARIEQGSLRLVDEVAAALRPCLGSIIAITGHTDTSGREPDNIRLSRDRAETIRNALVERGIPADGLRIRGVGSQAPITGLDPADPANRRIEFSVVETVAVIPTPVDVPGAR